MTGLAGGIADQHVWDPGVLVRVERRAAVGNGHIL
jgi:hypothetical protein